jgi:hypothetical protein
MASNLRVDQITASTTGSVSIGTATFTGSVSLPSGGVTVATGATISGSTNTITALTNSSERVRITSNGSIGIGTDNPAEDVHIQSVLANVLIEGTNDTVGGNVANLSLMAPYYRKVGYSIKDSAGNEDFFIGRPYGEGDSNPDLVINMTGTEKVRVKNGGNVQIANGNLVFSTSGTGIDFSATANSSGTMSSELLDDYEEGTWTPSAYLSYNPSSRGVSTSNSEGRYIKVGNLVICYYRFTYTLTGSGSFNLGINNLPFTSKNSAFNYVGGGTAREDQYTGVMFIAESILTNSTVLQVFRRYDNGAPRDPDGNLSGSLSYLTD